MQNSGPGARRHLPAIAIGLPFALVLSLALAACGGSSSSGGDTSSGSGGDSTAAASSSQTVSQARAAVTRYAKPPGSYREPSDSGVAPVEGKEVWMVSVGNEVESVAEGSRLFLQGLKAIGWTGKVYDGKLQPTEWLAGVRQAVQAGADGIVVVGFDCAAVKQGLIEAREKGIPVVAVEGIDCSELGQKGPRLFTSRVGYSEGTFPEWLTAYGNLQADFTIAETDGKAKVLYLRETDAQSAKLVADQYASRIEACAGCEIVERIDFVAAELGPNLQEQVQQALLKHPEADVVYGNYDYPVVASVAPAVRAAGKEGVLVIGAEGSEPNLELIRQGEQSMAMGFVNGWESYAAIDNLNSIFAGEKPIEDSGMGVMLIDREHNLPPKGQGVQMPIDWQGIYERNWQGE